MEDLISRQSVLNVISKIGLCKCSTNEVQAVDECLRAVEALPPVTQRSETVTEFADKCRECGARYGKYRKEAKRWKNKWLKSQKSGKWNEYYTSQKGNNVFNCKECGHTFVVTQGKDNMNYCPNCGCAMKGE